MDPMSMPLLSADSSKVKCLSHGATFTNEGATSPDFLTY